MILTVTLNPTIDRVYFLESYEAGKVMRVKNATCSAGGKGINVARVARILGCETSAMGYVGGYTGEFIKTEMESQGVKNLFTDIKGVTRTCVNISDKSGKSSELLEAGPEITEEEKIKFISDFSSVIRDYSIIVVSGSLPKGLTPDFYKELVRIAKDNHKKIIVDTSGNALKEILGSKPYMVKPNDDEVSELMGKAVETNADIKEALYYLKEMGVEIPFISLGKNGAAALIEGKAFHFIPPAVKAVNTVGSGDSAVAGVSAGIDMGYDLISAFKLGMAAGSVNTLFEKTGYVTKELVDSIFKQISVNEI